MANATATIGGGRIGGGTAVAGPKLGGSVGSLGKSPRGMSVGGPEGSARISIPAQWVNLHLVKL